jgi:ribosomal protein S27E
MSDRFISLKCQSCGAPLQVYDDMTRFACGFCGTEMLVERRGGTVALKSIEQAIQLVQAGTDRTAAELALVRLQKELAAKEQEVPLLRAATLPGTPESFVVGAVFCGIVWIGKVIADEMPHAEGAGAFVILLSVGLGITLAYKVFQEFHRTAKQENGPALASAEADVADLKRRIAENASAANSERRNPGARAVDR